MKAHVYGYPAYYHRRAHLHIGAVCKSTPYRPTVVAEARGEVTKLRRAVYEVDDKKEEEEEAEAEKKRRRKKKSRFEL